MSANRLTASIRQSLIGANPAMPANITNGGLLKLLSAIEAAQNAGTGDVMSDGSVPFTGQEDFQAGLKVDTITASGTSAVSIANQLGLKSYTTAQRDLLVSVEGCTIYNDDTDTIDYYDGVAWNSLGGGGWGTTGTVATLTGASTLDTDGNTFVISDGAGTTEVGINGAAEATFALKVTGVAKVTGSLLVETNILQGDQSTSIEQPATNQMLLTASAGVSTSAGLAVGGGFAITSQLSISDDAVLDGTKFTILCDTSIKNIAVTLPSAASHTGRIITVVNIGGGNDVTVSTVAGGNPVLGSNVTVMVQSDGANWNGISKYTP